MLRYIVLILFVCGMIATGLLVRKRVKNENDFMLGGGKLGGWMSAFAYGTTYFSAVVFIGYGGSISWQYGLSSIWIGIGNALIGTLAAWLLLGKRTYRAMHAVNAKTMPEYFEKRYDSKALKYIASVIIFVFLVPYSASVYTGLGVLFENAFGINLTTVIIAMGLLTAVYLVMGGYLATAVNDFIQGIVMIIGIVIVTALVIFNPEIGGFSGGMQTLAEQSAEAGVQLNSPFEFNLNLICLILMTSVGAWGLPQMAHKFHAIKDEKSIKKATVISTLFALIIAGGSYLIGTFGRVYMNGVKPMDDGDRVVPAVLDLVLSPKGVIGDVLYGIIAVMVLSASMSTLAAIVLTSSSTVTVDLVNGGTKPRINKANTMRVLRGLCFLFVIISVAIAIKKPAMIVDLMSYSWGAVAGAFIGPYVLGMYVKWINKYGVAAGFISGVVLTLLGITGVLNMPAPNVGALAIAASFIVTALFSFVTKKAVCKNKESAAAQTE